MQGILESSRAESDRFGGFEPIVVLEIGDVSSSMQPRESELTSGTERET